MMEWTTCWMGCLLSFHLRYDHLSRTSVALLWRSTPTTRIRAFATAIWNAWRETSKPFYNGLPFGEEMTTKRASISKRENGAQPATIQYCTVPCLQEDSPTGSREPGATGQCEHAAKVPCSKPHGHTASLPLINDAFLGLMTRRP